MASKFNKNAIINGFIDYFCLVCETYFGTEEAAEQHMEKQVHKKNLETSAYMDKYKGDCVRKVKSGYFCEYCNMLLSTGTKVNLHIGEKTHQDNKGIALLKYVKDDVVAFNEVVIKEEAWHGLSGDTCAICNCDVEDYVEHKVDHAHVLKLVQGRIQFGWNNNLYRNVDESAFQCLTCNKILAMGTLDQHFNDSEHQQIYARCIINNMKDDPSNSLVKKDDSVNTAEKKQLGNPTPTLIKKSPDKSNLNILDYISKFQENGINIKLELEKAFCKKCYVDISFDYSEIKSHIAEHSYKKVSTLSSPAAVEQNYKTTDVKPKTNINKPNKGKKENQFYPNINSNNNGDSDTSNVGTATNSEIKSMPVKKPICSGGHLPKQRMGEFIQEMEHIMIGFGIDIIIINHKYALTFESFAMFKILKTDMSQTLTCLHCDDTFDVSNMYDLIRKHFLIFETIPVVLRDDDEFVREIRSGMYHCGYCNTVVGDWSDFEEHMKCDSHKQTKRTMKCILNDLRSEHSDHRRQSEMRYMYRRS